MGIQNFFKKLNNFFYVTKKYLNMGGSKNLARSLFGVMREH